MRSFHTSFKPHRECIAWILLKINKEKLMREKKSEKGPRACEVSRMELLIQSGENH